MQNLHNTLKDKNILSPPYILRLPNAIERLSRYQIYLFIEIAYTYIVQLGLKSEKSAVKESRTLFSSSKVKIVKSTFLEIF